MSKDLEEGEIEEGELPEDLSDNSLADDEPGRVTEAASLKADPAAARPDPPLEPDPAKAPADSALTPSVAPPDLSLLGLPSYDAPVHSYGSSMAFTAYGSAPYGASVPAQLLDRRHSHIRDSGHASTSYDSPRFARHSSGVSFASRRSDPRGYSPSYSQDRYADQYADSSSIDSRQGTSMAADDDSSDEGELRPVNRSLSSRARNGGSARDIKTISASIQSLASTANVPAAMKSLETVSLALMDALADLEELQEALSGSNAVKADDDAQLADISAKFFKGLSVVHLVCNTGVGKTSNLTAAGKLVRAAVAHQNALLTAAQRKELNGWTKSSKVFKALADGEEESVQPKKPKAEAQHRTPYVPRQGKTSGQKRQGKGNQQGPKGKKQKKSGLPEAAVKVDAEAPPLPPPDSLSAYDSSQTMVQEDDDSLPMPPLPPPSPESPQLPSAVLNGNSSDQKQPASGPLALPPELGSTHSTLLPPEAASVPQGRTQVGFKLQASKRQKLKVIEAEEPVTHGMRERLERHLALQQLQLQQQQEQQQQQQASQLQQQQQQQSGHAQQLQQSMQSEGRPELQAPREPLPLSGPPPALVHPSVSTHQLPHAAVPGATHEPCGDLPSNTRHSRHAQAHSEAEEQRHARHRQAKHPRHDAADESPSLVPGLEPDVHQLPPQLHQAEPELPPGLAPELDQSSRQSPQQLQRRLSHRHVHHRRSRHNHRTDRTDPELQQHAEPALLPDGVLPNSHSEPQQADLGLRALPGQLTMHQDVNIAPSNALPADMPDRHQAGVHNGPQPGLGDLAESGGPVAVASGAVGALAEVQVLADDVKSLLRQHKLCLVLDLDHTLINSARFSEVDPEHEAMLRSHQANEALRLPEDRRELFRLDRIQMWTKLRPAVRQFLETAHEHFELWIHTNGNRSYAAAIVELLDPSGRLFGQRIISQGAAGDGVQQDLTKRLMQGLEGREPIALVVDDTSSVWGNHEENLVAVERYIYFPASRRQFGSKSKALLELRRDETPQSGMLMTALNVLLRTHRRTFRVLQDGGGVESSTNRSGERPCWDVRQVLHQERKQLALAKMQCYLQVLAGVHIMFSRVIPLQEGRPEQHPMWRKAVKFGATCTTQPNDAVTHVAAYVNGTEKVYWAQRTGKYVVTPEWLNCSAMLWKRAAEDAFPVIATA